MIDTLRGMMKCKFCGKNLPSDALECKGCGAPVDLSEKNESPRESSKDLMGKTDTSGKRSKQRNNMPTRNKKEGTAREYFQQEGQVEQNAKTGFILGIASLATLMFLPMIGFPVPIAGIVFGYLGLKAKNRAKVITGLVFSGIAMAGHLGLAFYVVIRQLLAG